MLTPTIANGHYLTRPHRNFDLINYVLQSEGMKKDFTHPGGGTYLTGHIVGRVNGQDTWSTTKVYFDTYEDSEGTGIPYTPIEDGIRFVKVAYPIDPRMTKKDIEGANRIYKNADQTGWLFAHAETGHHHERVILLEAIMHTLFEDLIHDRLGDVLKAVIGHNNPRPQIGTELLYTYNAQSGAFANYGNIIDFRKECIKWCSEVEKLLHIGQHIQEDDHALKHQLVRSIEQAKLIWKADTGKKRILAGIESQVNAIIARVETDHEIDTRWVKAKKRADAAAAAAAAAESSDDSETETEDE